MSFIMSGKNLALSSLQPHGDDLVAITAGKHAQFFHGWKYAWGVNICQGVKHIDSLFANRPACACGGIQLTSTLRKCLQPQQLKRNGSFRCGSFRHGSGFWMPAHAPHEGSTGTDGIQEGVRGPLTCATAAACLQGGVMTTLTLTVIKQHQGL